jgi:hypothetical protein
MKSLWNHQKGIVSAREMLFASFWSFWLAAFLILPYIFAYIFSPYGFRFVGNFANIFDQYIYFTYVQQASEGIFFLKNLYSYIPHEGAVINLYFSFLGLLVRYFSFSLDTAYQVGRFLTSWGLGMAAYFFAALFFVKKERILCWIAILFVSGFRWVFEVSYCLQPYFSKTPPAIWSSSDFWIHEGFVFSSLFYIPLFSLAITGILLVLRWICIGMLTFKFNKIFLASLMLALLNFIHPYDVILIAAITSTFTTLLILLKPEYYKNWLLYALTILILGLAPSFYNFYFMSQNPGFISWIKQSICTSPGFGGQLRGFGVPLFFTLLWIINPSVRSYVLFFLILVSIFFINRLLPETILGYSLFSISYLSGVFFLWYSHCFRKILTPVTPTLLVVSWLFVTPLLTCIPLSFQRRLIIGFSVPIAIGMMQWLKIYFQCWTWSKKYYVAAITAVIAISSITSMINYFQGFNAFLNPDSKFFIVQENPFISTEEIKIFSSFIQKNHQGTVLSYWLAGTRIPRFSGMPIVSAKSNQCEKRIETGNLVERFYRGAMEWDEMAKFLDEHYVQYVYYGVEEQTLDENKMVPEWLLSHGWKRMPGEKDSLFQAFEKVE